MNIFPRKSKTTPGAYYLGEFDDKPLAPFSISMATFMKGEYSVDPKHFHQKHQKVYLTLEGEGVLNVNGQEVRMIPEQLIQVEPGEVHFVQAIESDALKFIAILGAKENDKVVVG